MDAGHLLVEVWSKQRHSIGCTNLTLSRVSAKHCLSLRD